MRALFLAALFLVAALKFLDRVHGSTDLKQESASHQTDSIVEPQVRTELEGDQSFHQKTELSDLYASVQSRLRTKRNAEYFDAETFTNRIQQWVNINSKSGDRSGFVGNLVAEASRQAKPGYNVLVYNLNQDYSERLIDSIAYATVNAYGLQFGVWLLKCGHVHNNGGMRGSDSWGYSGQYVNEGSGKGAYLMDQDCPNKAYRPFNDYLLPGKDLKTGRDLRTFDGVNSLEECSIKMKELGGWVATHVHEWRNCRVHRTDFPYNDGKTYANDGSLLGSFDLYFMDKEQTNSAERRQQWIARRECDLIHTRHGSGESWCKKIYDCWSFTKDAQCVTLFRRD